VNCPPSDRSVERLSDEFFPTGFQIGREEGTEIFLTSSEGWAREIEAPPPLLYLARRIPEGESTSLKIRQRENL